MNIAIAGFRHSHIYSIYNLAKSTPDVHVCAAYEADAEARSQAEKYIGKNIFADSYDELLENPAIDAIAVGDFYSARGGLVIRALKAGKHVISDKPLCTSPDELSEIKALARETGLKIGCMLDLRYTSEALAAKRIFNSGALGEIRTLAFTGQHPLNYGTRPSWYFEKGKHGGTINDIAIHGIDLVRYLTELEVSEPLFAYCRNAFAESEPDFPDCAQFLAKLSNGAGLMADVSYALPKSIGFSPEPVWRFTFWGSRGMLEINHSRHTVYFAPEGANQPEIIEASRSDCADNFLTDFIADISGRPAALNTAEVLRSAEETLNIQLAVKRQ